MSDRPSGQPPSRTIAVLGPTNTGKTHLAIERMIGYASGMIGLPLRLLAREVYDRIVKLRGKASVALITGEEKIVPPRAVYFVCTVEAMPLTREVEFLAIDEIQLAADPTRGHVFTDRLLHARGRYETMFLGSASMSGLIRRLLPDVEFVDRERFSTLTYAGSKKLTRLPRRTAVVAFSAERVYAIAELIRRQRGGAAVVMGSLSPRTRNAQVALYQSGEVDFLVATDAIGMGLNMDVDHVAFAGLRKFDGKRTRWLTRAEVAQVAGRAGRYRRNGTFGVTGEAEEMDPGMIEAVEEHLVEPIDQINWRSARLDFQTLPGLVRSLAAPPVSTGLKLADQALDETSLRLLAADPEVVGRARGGGNLHTLWDICQTPDFRKTTMDEHLRLVREVFFHLTEKRRRLPEDWIAGQFAPLDRTDGEIDVLAQRLAGVRTLAYAANRSDWLVDAQGWREKTHALEDRLSDTLHLKLMQRFIDRRTSVLMRSLSTSEDILAGVSHDGAVTVEGQAVGRLTGVQFEPERGSTALETKALRAAAVRAVGPEIARRLGRLAADANDAFAFDAGGHIRWEGAEAGRIAGGSPFRPRVELFGELGPAAARERARMRLEAFVAAEAHRRLAPLAALDGAMRAGELKGLARGLAFRLIEAGGVLDRRCVAAELQSLSQNERRTLRILGVRFAAFSLHLPAVLTDEGREMAIAFAGLGHHARWTPPPNRLVRLPHPVPPERILAAHGLVAAGAYAVPVALLERLDAAMRSGPDAAGALVLTPEALAGLDLEESAARAVLKGLGLTTVRRTEPGQPSYWRRRKETVREAQTPSPNPANPTSPFAALAGLTAPPARVARRRPRKRGKRSGPTPA